VEDQIGETPSPWKLVPANSVTSGIVSAVRRTVQGETGRTYTDFIQTDAAINPGNSGGALANILGELIGINTAIVGGANTIGFAIPVDRVRRIAEELRRYGESSPSVSLRGRPSHPAVLSRIPRRAWPGSPPKASPTTSPWTDHGSRARTSRRPSCRPDER
jgi:S1-C subfamily serine protease